jgi:hypothetical protein
MTGPAEQRWVEAMCADLQRQIDELSEQLNALSDVVHAHTIRALASDDHVSGGDNA